MVPVRKVCKKRSCFAKDLTKAYDFYELAFFQGDFNAAYELGRMRYYGLGITKNKELAESFIQISKQKKLPIRKISSRKFAPPTKTKSSSYTGTLKGFSII